MGNNCHVMASNCVSATTHRSNAVAIDMKFRQRAVKTLTNEIGVYVLCDLDDVPIYVGQSVDGIRSRVNRHLTSARSDIIANRQIDVWEIAWVRAFPTAERIEIGPLENALFHHFDKLASLMNGKVPPKPAGNFAIPEPSQIVKVMSDEEIKEKRDPALRLPRQAEHYSQIVGHFLAVKNSKEIARAMNSHFERLKRYHRELLGLAADVEDGPEG
jgi:Uri superfamily endonuclease